MLDCWGMSLASYMADHSLNDAEVGARLGVTAEAVRLWRHGKRRIAPITAKRIEREFGIPLHLLRPDIWQAPAPVGAV